MRARFRTLRDNGVHARLAQRARFFSRGGGAEHEYAARLKPRHSVSIRNAERKAEDGRARVQHGFELRREWIGPELRERWGGKPERVVDLGQQREHRRWIETEIGPPAAHEQIHLEWPVRKRADSPDGVRDLIGRKIRGAQRTEAARVGYRRDQLRRARPAAHGALDDRILDAELLQELVGHSLSDDRRRGGGFNR